MIRYIAPAATFVFALLAGALFGGTVLINEIACETAGDDWVELFYYDEEETSIDISPLFVTMYYGTNERLGSEPITLYSRNRPETPFDDRFAVVHLARPGMSDETDSTGDTNGNGILDVYCNNYFSSLWNTDCVVSIDIDDEPANGGIIDFAAYSNRDGSLNSTIGSYTGHAIGFGQWESLAGDHGQACMVDIGIGGLKAHQSIARKDPHDSNTQADFAITSVQTPGRENIFSGDFAGSNRLFRALKKTSVMDADGGAGVPPSIDVFVYEPCNLRLRVFSPLGRLIYESPLYRDVFPGPFSMPWDVRGAGRRASTGLHVGLIEATAPRLKRSDSERIFIIPIRGR